VALVYVPLLVVAGPHTVYEGVIGNSAREGSYWRLPFPVHYRGPLPLWPPWHLAKHAKDVLVFYVPLLLVIGLALGVAAALWRRRGLALATLGAGGLAYLLSRTDDLHNAPLLAVVVVLLAAAGAWLIESGRRGFAALPLVVLALLTLYGLSNRVSALVLPPHLATIHVNVADGVEDTPSNAAALDRDHGLLTSPSAQAGIVAVLRRTHPKVIIRWTDPISSQPEPNKRGRSSGSRILDDYINANYRLLQRDGFYNVMVPR
jgi:hypothetical protein